MKRRIILLSTALAIALVIAGWIVSRQQSVPSPQVSPNLNSKQKVEDKYIANMIAQYQESEEVLTLAKSQAFHPALKTLVSEMADKRKAELSKFQTWQKEWAGSSDADTDRLPSWVQPSDFRSTLNQIREAKGNEFDEAFLNYLEVIVQSEIQLSHAVEGKLVHAELKDFRERIIDNRYSIYNKVTEWKIEWGYIPRHH